jgi:hypothetical protein
MNIGQDAMAQKVSDQNVFALGPSERTVLASDGTVRDVPAGWELLPPGDAGLTRRAKAAGVHWIVQEKRGRKTFSRGVWTDSSNIARIRADLAHERSTEAYAKRKVADEQRRERVQNAYVETFFESVLRFLNFAPAHAELAERLSKLVTEHATPVGSGTVARTKRISVDQRCEAAVIAWMRHQTTAYDSMKIERVKGKRREVRRMLAQRSHEVLRQYRSGQSIPADCPLRKF